MSHDPSQFGNPYTSPSPAPVGYDAPPSGANNSLAIAALITGIMGLGSVVVGLCCCPLVGIPLPLIALGLGIAAQRDSRTDASGRGMALGAIICGAVGLLVSLALLIFTFAAVGIGALQPNVRPPFE